jgi:hypothetical protein
MVNSGIFVRGFLFRAVVSMPVQLQAVALPFPEGIPGGRTTVLTS